MKTINELDIQVCRRKKTKDGLGEECFCVEDFKKEIKQSAIEDVKELRKQVEDCGDAFVDMKKRLNERNKINIDYIMEKFCLTEDEVKDDENNKRI